MDWGFAILALLGILGAALIAGGLVAYRGSRRLGVRVFAAAAVAVGVVLWMFILFVVPVSSVTTGG